MPRGRIGLPPPRTYPQQARQQMLERLGLRRRGGGSASRPPLPTRVTPPPFPSRGPETWGASGTTAQAPPGGPGSPGGLPLSPEFEAGRRTLEDTLAAALGRIGAARQQVPLEADITRQRLQTNQFEDERRTREAANARGLFGGSVMGTGLRQVGQGYGRQREDLASAVARQLADLADQESQARLGYQSSLAELLMAAAGQAAMDESAPGFSDLPWNPVYANIPMPGGGGRSGGKGKGGGGGGKKKGGK